MSTTRITRVKVAGHLGEDICQLFHHWLEVAKNSDSLDSSLLDVQTKDASIYYRIVSLSNMLEEHCDFASIVWFQQFVDSWTVAPSLHATDDFKSLAGHVRTIRCKSLDIMLLTASDRNVARCLKDVIVASGNQRGCSTERRHFLKQMRLCAISCQPFLESYHINTVKLVFFHALGPSHLDDDIIKMAGITPEWFQKERDRQE